MFEKKPQKAYRIHDLEPFTGVRLTQTKKMIKAGDFPPGTKINPNTRTRVWFEEDLARWQEERRAKVKA